MYDDNCFITLTYNNDNLPEYGSVKKSEVQRFMRRLRRDNDKKIRFLASGEYGEKLNRPHYHICLFNHDFNDKTIHEGRYTKSQFTSGPDHILYRSKELESLWNKGFSTIGDLSFHTASYTARYVTKKVTGKHKKKWYGKRNPEFALMSRMPGLGRPWIEKYFGDVYPKDYCHVNGIRMRPPIYYDSYLKKEYPEMYQDIKERRREYSEKKERETSIRGMQRENHRKSITKQLERKFENEG